MIPAEAVEAAAKAVEESLQTGEGVRDIARAALESAAPYMQDRAAEDRLLAMVWNEGAMAAIANPGARLVNPYKKAPNAR